MRVIVEAPGRGDAPVSLVGGVTPGMFPYSGGLWYDGENVVFREGGPRAMNGWTAFATAPGRVRAIGQALNQLLMTPRVYFGTDTSLLVWTESTNIVSTLKNGYTSGRWSFATWGNWLAAVNGSDGFQLWKGEVGTEPETVNTVEADFSWAKIIIRKGPHLIVMNTSGDNGGSRIVWCSADNPEEWDISDPNTTAGDLFIRDLESDIVAAAYLGDDIAVYSKDGLARLQYLGYPYIFGAEKLLNNIGAVGHMAVVSVGEETGNKNFGFGPQGIWVTDGTAVEYIDTPAIRKFLLADMDWTLADKVVAYHDEAEQQVIFFYPRAGSSENNAGVGYNYSNGAWTRYSFGRSAAVERAVFDYPITGDATSLYFQGQGELAVESWIQSQPLDLGDATLFKRVQYIGLTLDADTEPTLSLGGQINLEDAIEWFHSAVASTRNHLQDFETVFLSLKIAGTAPWALTGFSVLGEPAGVAR